MDINNLATDVLSMLEILDLSPYDLGSDDWENENQDPIQGIQVELEGTPVGAKLVSEIMNHPKVRGFLANKIGSLLKFAQEYDNGF